MNLKYKLHQSRPYRTRIQFRLLKDRPELCRSVAVPLQKIKGVLKAEVRIRTGSVILVHPASPVEFEEVLSIVKSVVANSSSVGTESSPVARSSADPRPYHVSGFTLAVTGAYLFYLMGRRLLGIATRPESLGVRLFSAPAIVAFVLAVPVLRQAIGNLRKNGRPDMGLISTSLLFVSIFTGNILTALTVAWLFNLSGWIEDRIRIRTRQAVREMLSGKSRRAWLVTNDGEIEVDVDELQPGDLVSVSCGATIPVDGFVISGSTLVNEASMTGESMPVYREVGSQVLAGTVVEEGEIQVKAEKTGEYTRLASIIRLIEEAENDPGELQQMSVRFSQTMVPVSLSLAALAFLLTGNLLQAMAVLIITCPCAVRLSTSVAVSSAMSLAATDSIFIKGGKYVEIAGRTDVLVLDKTGTLTETASEVTAVVPVDKRFKEKTLLQLAASAQKRWSHPLSRAVLDKADEQGVDLLQAVDKDLVVGQGVTAEVAGKRVLVGSRRFMEDAGIELRSAKAGDYEKGNLYIARDGKLLGLFETRSRLRKSTKEAIERIRSTGVKKIVLLTGDTKAGVNGLREQFGFDEVLWEQTPEKKAAWIADWKNSHPEDVVTMVGDGINDTPAFAEADLSMAIGDGGADVAVEYSDIVLQRGGVEKVAETIELSSNTLKIIKECYTLAIGLNSLSLALTVTGTIAPVAGAVIHNGITLAAVSNGASIRKLRKEES